MQIVRSFIALVAIAFAAVMTILLGASSASAQTSASATAGHYSLRNPVPAAFLRDLSTDRPDRTESPFTVDVGHVQVEMDLFNTTDDRQSPHSFGIGAVNAKLGLRSNIDFQLVTELVSITRELDAYGNVASSRTSASVLTGRLKINLFGNDSGRAALALMPYVTVPRTVAPGDIRVIEGGLIVPLGLDIGRGWGMGLMSEIDIVRNESGIGRQVNQLHSATVSHDVFGPVGAYGEVVAEITGGPVKLLVPTADAGVTVGFGPRLQLDFGANVGLNTHADRFTAFVGISKLF